MTRPANAPPSVATSLRLIGALLVFFLAARIVTAKDEAGPSVVFLPVTVVDVKAGNLLENRAVIVRGGVISAVVGAEDVQSPAGATVVDGTGKYLIPGLWDMHTHHDFPWTGLLELALVNGVIGVRDMNSEAFVLKWRDEIRNGSRLGPRIVASGKYLDGRLNGQPPNRVSADNPEQARELVRGRKQAGAEFIKVYSGLRPEVYRAVIDEAKLLGLPVAGHCPELASIVDASNLGQRSVEHLTGVALACARDEAALRKQVDEAFAGKNGYDIDEVQKVIATAMKQQDPAKQSALFEVLKRNQTWQVPTLVVQRPLPARDQLEPRLQYVHRAITALWDAILTNDRHAALRQASFEYARSMVRQMHAAGVPLLAGTDAGGSTNVRVFTGFSLADELELFVECGLSPADALRTATLNPAQYFEEEKTAGTVADGKRADLVLLDGNPLDEIGNVRKIAGVMVNGRWLPRAELDQMLATAAASTGAGMRPGR
jgi:imidazolonepropionase-like amidohydrolase